MIVNQWSGALDVNATDWRRWRRSEGDTHAHRRRLGRPQRMTMLMKNQMVSKASSNGGDDEDEWIWWWTNALRSGCWWRWPPPSRRKWRRRGGNACDQLNQIFFLQERSLGTVAFRSATTAEILIMWLVLLFLISVKCTQISGMVLEIPMVHLMVPLSLWTELLFWENDDASGISENGIDWQVQADESDKRRHRWRCSPARVWSQPKLNRKTTHSRQQTLSAQ